MPVNSLFAQVLDEANRADPYPLYARLRKTPLIREDDGTYVVSTYAEIRNLLHDPRLSSADRPKPIRAKTGNPLQDYIINPVKNWIIDTHQPLIFRDPPDHTRLRRFVMTQFTTERVGRINGRVHAIVDELIGKMCARKEIDIVEDFAYPLPVSVICELLGVPPGDQVKFHKWSTSLVGVLDPKWRASEDERIKTIADYEALMSYLSGLIKAKRKRPAGDILSGLATYKDKKLGRMGKFDLLATASLLLVAGHETTVNLIANGMLTLLRHPEWLERLRQDPAHALSRSFCVSSRRFISVRARHWRISPSPGRWFQEARPSSLCLPQAIATRCDLPILSSSIRIAATASILASAGARIIA